MLIRSRGKQLSSSPAMPPANPDVSAYLSASLSLAVRFRFAWSCELAAGAGELAGEGGAAEGVAADGDGVGAGEWSRVTLDVDAAGECITRSTRTS